MTTFLQKSCNELILNESINSQQIYNNEITEGRALYLTCLEQSNYNNLIKEKFIDPYLNKYNVSAANNNLIKIKVISKTDITYSYDKYITTNIFTLGRSSLCDIIVNDIDVSRIHFFGILLNDKILIIDTWSLYGTSIYDNTIDYSTYINNRNIFKMDKNKRSILELKNYLIIFNCDKIHNNKYCLICMEHPRIIRNSCGHGVLCQDCNNKLLFNENKKCPICKDIIKSQKLSMCEYTFKNQSNTL